MSQFKERLIGLDLGSTAAKMVVLTNRILKFKKVVPSHMYKNLINEIEENARVFVTGYYRKNVESEISCTEITAAKHGVKHLLKQHHQEIDVLVDIGGQDTKIIDLRKQNFILNDKCSAGTGAFLQFMSQYLGVEIEELEDLHRKANGKRVNINSTCSVFALSEVVSHLVENTCKEEVISGIHYAFARRISYMIPKNTEKIALFGGPALNQGVVESLADILGLTVGENIIVVTPSQFVNAIGTIIYGMSQN